MFKVKKVFNNSVVLAKDEQERELLIRGKGIAFNVSPNQELTLSKDARISYITSRLQLVNVIENVPEELFQLTQELVDDAEEKLGKTLNPSLLFSLADHIHNAIHRQEKNREVNNIIKYEIPHLYNQEYLVGKKILKKIAEKTTVKLPDSEAAYIAMHLVNAQLITGDISQTLEITEITKDIVLLIQKEYGISIDKTSMVFSRFVVHLRYLIERHYKQNLESSDSIGLKLLETMSQMYQKNYIVARDIQEFLQREYGWSFGDGELVYLIIHLERLLEEHYSRRNGK